tara:strand:+ start:846 stop:1121 length:276 start_codon:yes stop_codon:yes gene_type:complete
MEKELDSILQILEKASTTKDVEELNQIEQQLQHFIKIIDKSNYDDLLSKNIEISNRVEKLKNLIKKLDSSNNLNNELFLEFQKFIENRKFK